ncbi:MAG: MSCRAMM family protein [Dehalococcoidia bacterium]
MGRSEQVEVQDGRVLRAWRRQLHRAIARLLVGPCLLFLFAVHPAGTWAQTSGGTATLTVVKTLLTSTGQPAAGTLAGYTFTVIGQNGLPSQTQTTDTSGRAVFANVPSGSYLLVETPIPGTTLASIALNGTPIQPGQPFQVAAGGVTTVTVTNIVSGTATVILQEQVVEQNGRPVNAISLAGYSFTLAPQGTLSSPPQHGHHLECRSGSRYACPWCLYLAEAPSQNRTLVGYTINGIPTPNGSFILARGQATNIVITNRTLSPVTSSSPAGRMVRS